MPKEIIKFLLSFLDDKNARVARLVNTDWFRWISYANFGIYFPTPTLLPQIVDRLSTYQYPIELSFNKPLHLSHKDILEHLPRLTQLRAFSNFDYSDMVNDLETQEYFKLSTLTNLERLKFRFDMTESFPVKLLQHFPKMKFCGDLPEGTEELMQIINTHCPDYEFMRVPDGLLSIVPDFLTGLTIYDKTGKSFEALTRLTRLKTLDVMFEEEPTSALDLRHITWLEKIYIDSSKVIGLEYSHNLTDLEIVERECADVTSLLESLKMIPKLHKLDLLVPNCQPSLSVLSVLTALRIECETLNAASLPTTLQMLKITGSPLDLAGLSHLVHLTHLFVSGISTVIEPLHTLTKLQHLHLRLESPCHISFSTLGNLTRINASKVLVDPQTIRSLTSLQHLRLTTPPEQATIENLKYLSHLTCLDFRFEDGEDFLQEILFDYKVIEMCPLAMLQVRMPKFKNAWKVLPTLTTLEDLTVEFVEEEDNIASLTALRKLTTLMVANGAENVTCVHVTKLTALQDLNLDLPTGLLYDDLALKLTRLQFLQLFEENILNQLEL